MKIAAPKNVKRAGLSAAAVAALLSATGCSATSPVATAEVDYAPADGIVVELGEIDLTNMLVVATGAEEPGRLLGSMANDTERPVTVTVDNGFASAEILVPAFETVRLTDVDPVILDPAGASPGLMVETEFSVAGESLVDQVPVLDHSFPRYAEFVPGGAPSTPANPSLHPEPAEEGGGH